MVDESVEPISQLEGFQKHHRVPTSSGESDHRFIADIAHNQIDADLQNVFTSLRNSYGLKRKEITVNGPVDGGGVISTAFFSYEIHVAQDSNEPGKVVWRRAVSEISEPGRVFAAPFEQVFGQRFLELELSVDEAMDLESIVDHIEDADDDSIELDYDKDVTWIEIQIPHCAMSVVIRENSIRAISRKPVSPRELLDNFLQAQQSFAAVLGLMGGSLLDRSN